MQYVLHTHFSDTKIPPRRTAIVEMNANTSGETPVFSIEPKTFRFLQKE